MIRRLIYRFPYVFWTLLCFTLFAPVALVVDIGLFGWDTWRFWQVVEMHFWSMLLVCPQIAFVAACTPTRGLHP